MSSVDLHPEDLLDREARGELSDPERGRLDAHLKACAVCRFERLARADFARETEQSSETLDVQRMLSAVLVPEATRALVASPSPRRVRRLRLVLVAAAAVMVAGVSMAAVQLSTRSRHGVVPAQVAETPTTGQHPPPLSAPPEQAVTALPVEPSAPTAVTIDPQATPQAPRPSRPDAASMFSQATAARRSGDQGAALTLYRRLMDRYPASPEAHESAAVLGRMLLDRGDPGAAIDYFDGYLRTGGALREDVMAGRAVALQRVGRVDDEARAWSALLRDYPSSVHAARARLRLAELGKP